MFSRDSTDRNPRLYEAVAAFVLEARENYRRGVNERTYMPCDSKFPSISTFEDSGFPYVSPGIDARVPEYDRLFRQGAHEVDRDRLLGEWDSWKRLVEVVEGHERLREVARACRRGRCPPMTSGDACG